MTTSRHDGLVTWMPWTADAFAQAARERKPILLSITTAWCAECRDMDRTTYAEPRVAALIADRFVPIRVDADERPDINERYNLGGWPTTAFLTPDGELLGGGTFVSADRMPAVLQQVMDAIDTRGGEIARAQRAIASGASAPHTPAGVPVDELVDVVFESFDDEYGGFGRDTKFPLTAPLHLALALHGDQGDGPWQAIVERSLDAIRGGGLRDVDGGGFFRYATTRDWGSPHPEKLLETNASLLRIYAEAARIFERETYLETCADIAAYIRQRLGASRGGYRGSEADTTVYTDTSVAASGALLAASAALDDLGIGREALEQLERVLLASYRPGEGVAHYVADTPRVRGLLVDQIATIHALLDAEHASGGEPYGMMAEELAHYVLRTMWDEGSGGVFDRAPDPAEVPMLRSPRKPFVANAEAARAFARLARTSGEPDFRIRAEAILQSLAPEALGHGPLAAHYLIAMRELRAR